VVAALAVSSPPSLPTRALCSDRVRLRGFRMIRSARLEDCHGHSRGHQIRTANAGP
jgi:hypothetical protein